MFLTCKFKLHNVSQRKREVIMHAFRAYTDGYNALLTWAKDNLDVIIERGQYCTPSGKCSHTGKSIASILPRLELDMHSSLKDSLLQDVAGNLASFLELGTDAGFPVARTYLDYEIDNALEYFISVGADIKDFEEAQGFLLRRAHINYMPLSFCRADGATKNRNFSLVANTEKPQLLAALWLLPNKHELSAGINATQGNLVRIDTGEVFTSNSKTAILVPLEIGRNGWQSYKFLDPAANQQAQVKTARLLLDGEDLYLAVAFNFPDKPRIKPQAYIGIDRGILFNAAYGVIDHDGAVLEMGHFDDDLRALQIKHGREREVKARNGKIITRRDYKTKAYDNILHVLANKIIALAIQYQAMIVFEDLNIKVRGGRVVSRFRKLESIVQYKATLEGIPVRDVFAAYSSMICHKCGGDMERDDRLVVCKECGYTGHSDDNAGVNIARRALYKKVTWEGKGGYRAFHRSFSQT